jgi:mycothiol synthase
VTELTGTDRIETLAVLPDVRQAQVRSLLAAATSQDGIGPVSEQVVLGLRVASTNRDAGRHLLLGTPEQLKGYAFAEDGKSTESTEDSHSTRQVELVVDPRFRRAGRGRTLLTEAASNAPAGGVQVWAHGDHPGARALADSLGYHVVRTLLQLRRSRSEVDPPAFPEGVTVRGFRPGQDDAQWLRLNARAFAHHPEQGRITQADLRARMDEPWFDPEGFLIAERDGVMIGFHWTKVHPEGLGEVYVVGVDPDLHGGGLGRALTQAGLRYLYAQGLRTVLLYVEADNAPALAVYRRLGFADWNIDVMYASGSEPTVSDLQQKK